MSDEYEVIEIAPDVYEIRTRDHDPVPWWQDTGVNQSPARIRIGQTISIKTAVILCLAMGLIMAGCPILAEWLHYAANGGH